MPNNVLVSSMIHYLCILWNDYNKLVFVPQRVTKIFFWWKDFNYSLHAVHCVPRTYHFITIVPFVLPSYPFCLLPQPNASGKKSICSQYQWGCFIFFNIPHTSEIINYLSFSDLFHVQQCPEGPSMLQMTKLHPFW